MEQRLAVLSLLFIVITVSGCTGGGNGVDNQGDTAIAVHQIKVTPADHEIFAGSNVRVRMSFSNVGELPAEVVIGKGSVNHGGQILTNHCPDIFSVQAFSASTSNVSATQKTYALAPGYKVRLNWNLKQDTQNVPLNGYRCNLQFEVPFNYSVEAFKQLQIKRNTEVKGSKSLFAKSSQGPMKLEIQAIGSSAPSGAPAFLKEDNAEVLIQLVNKKPKKGSFTGTVELGPPRVVARGVKFEKVNITSDNLDEAEKVAKKTPGVDASTLSPGDKARLCPNPSSVPEDGTINLYQGQSKIFRCDLDWDVSRFNNVPSIKAEIFAQADYKYVKTVGSKQVRVRYRGN
ncbi:MAG: hypothetical protein ABEJ36_04040 [Candidatus Nanosalina sp.]